MQIEKINKLVDIIINTDVILDDMDYWEFKCPYCSGHKALDDSCCDKDILISDIKHDANCMYSIAIDLKQDIQRIRKLNRINS